MDVERGPNHGLSKSGLLLLLDNGPREILNGFLAATTPLLETTKSSEGQADAPSLGCAVSASGCPTPIKNSIRRKLFRGLCAKPFLALNLPLGKERSAAATSPSFAPGLFIRQRMLERTAAGMTGTGRTRQGARARSNLAVTRLVGLGHSGLAR